MANPTPTAPPESPTPRQQRPRSEDGTTATEETPRAPVAVVVGASLRPAFQTPSALYSPSAASSITEVTTREYREDAPPAARAAAADAIEDTQQLPSYLLRLASRNDLLGVNLSNVLEEAAELGDGGDSDQEGDDARDHDVAFLASNLERMSLLEESAAVEDTADNCVVLAGGGVLSAAAVNPIIHIPDTPTDWEPPSQKIEQGEPNFAEVDNPGDWSRFVFRPEFGATAPKQYKRHSMPTGVHPVPKNPEGKRVVGDWEFHYKGWEDDAGNGGGRQGATGDDMFPQSRKGKLDADLLEMLGLTKERMVKGDALFFHQLLLPMGDPKMSGITADPRKPFYSQVEKFSNLYAIQIGLGGSYGHRFKNIVLNELVRFDGVVIRDGVKGGSNGAIHRRWMDGADFDRLVLASITHTRWLQIKRVMKLNNNDVSPKRGEAGYNPAFKFDMLYDVLISNLNAITKHAEADQCGDETTWGHGGYGEAGSGLAGRIMGKPGITRGGQIVIISDVSRCRPRAYVHRHKLQLIECTQGIKTCGCLHSRLPAVARALKTAPHLTPWPCVDVDAPPAIPVLK
jgi:hypothetical protein